MRRKYSIVILFYLLFSVTSFPQNQDLDLKLFNEISRYGQAEVTITLPDRSTMENLTRNVSIGSVRNRIVYIILTERTAPWFVKGNFSYKILERAESKGAIMAANPAEAADWQSYPSYSDYLTIMQGFASSYPSLCKLDTIGTSINGKLVLALKISDNVNTDEPEPEVFYSSTMHGDELAGFVLMLHLADSLLKGYASSQRIKNMVDNLEIWINPLANPDGTYRSGNTISSPLRANANGVDLNRNFPDPFTPSNIPEKENIDMISFMKKHRFVISANFHSGYEVVNYPWDRWSSKWHADDSWFINISRAYADTVHTYSSGGYMIAENNGITRGSDWYVIYGGRQDYVTWELQGREVTIELDYTKQTPATQLIPLWNYNKRSLLGYLENALYGIHGVIRDAMTSAPVAAKVYIKFHDKDSSSIYSDTLNGRFTRLLYPQTWDLTFKAGGYRDTTVTNIVVQPHQKTEILVLMKPISTVIDSIESLLPRLYPNPSEQFVKCMLPAKLTGNLLVRVFDNSGRKHLDYKTISAPAQALEIDISSLSPGVYTIQFINSDTGRSGRCRLVVSVRLP